MASALPLLLVGGAALLLMGRKKNGAAATTTKTKPASGTTPVGPDYTVVTDEHVFLDPPAGTEFIVAPVNSPQPEFVFSVVNNATGKTIPQGVGYIVIMEPGIIEIAFLRTGSFTVKAKATSTDGPLPGFAEWTFVVERREN